MGGSRTERVAAREMAAKKEEEDRKKRVEVATEKEDSIRAHQAAVSKTQVQERQLKTFLEANEALETDLRKQLARVAALERRKGELEAEQQTIEAYYVSCPRSEARVWGRGSAR